MGEENDKVVEVINLFSSNIAEFIYISHFFILCIHSVDKLQMTSKKTW